MPVPAVQLDTIFNALDPPTRHAFQVWQKQLSLAVQGNDQNLNSVLGNLPPFAADATDLLKVLDVQHTAVVNLLRNGGTVFKHSEAFSFQIATDNQEETDRYWNAIVGNSGTESQCGWCKDRWGLSWQITPRVLTDALAAGGGEAKRAFAAMMTMQKIDVAAIEAARRG